MTIGSIRGVCRPLGGSTERPSSDRQTGTALFAELLDRGTRRCETDLFDGEYFIQRVEWKSLRAGNPVQMESMVGAYSPEAIALMETEGPKYQYGTGCLSDGVLGSWMAWVCGVGQVLDAAKVKSPVRAVHAHNLQRDLSDFANPQRPSYACGRGGGTPALHLAEGR